MMKSATASTPSPALMFVKTNGLAPPHAPGVPVHHLEAGTDQRGKVDLVDDQEIRAGDAGTALARDLLAGRDIDHVDREIRELGAEGRGQVVAAGLDQQQLEAGKAPPHLADGGEVDRGVLADRRMGAAARLDAHDTLGRQGAGPDQDLLILLGVDVVRHHRHVVALAQPLAERLAERGLAGADRAANSDPQGPMRHERKSLVYCVSWHMEHQSTIGTEL